jgi:hypothetical protein
MPDAGLGHPQVEEQCRAVACRRRLGERTTEEDHLRFGSALNSRLARGRNQPVDDPAIVGGLTDEQVLGDARFGAWLFGEQLGGAAMALHSLSTGKLRVDAVANERMHERERPARLEDSHGRQKVNRLGSLELLEARESRCKQQVALLEDGQRSREPRGRLGQAKETEMNRATKRLYIASAASFA